MIHMNVSIGAITPNILMIF